MHIQRLEHIDSTNEYLINLLRNGGVSEPTAIWTDDQTGGKGRNGNLWHSNKGKDLALSVYWPHSGLVLSKGYMLNVCAALGAARALSARINGIRIKWPNDIMIEDKKVGGILITNTLVGRRIKDSVLGIGINVNSINIDETLPHATSILRVGHQYIDINMLAEEIIHFIRLLLHNIQEEEILMSEFNALLWKKNEVLSFKINKKVFQARVHEVDAEGKLWLEVDGELISYSQDRIRTILPVS